MEDIFKHINWDNIVSSGVTIIIAIILYQVVKTPFKKILRRDKNKERNTHDP